MKKFIFLIYIILLSGCTALNSTKEVSLIDNASNMKQEATKHTRLNESDIQFVTDSKANNATFTKYKPYYLVVNYPKTGNDSFDNELQQWATKKILEFDKTVINTDNTKLQIHYDKLSLGNSLATVKFNILTSNNSAEHTSIETKTFDFETGKVFSFKDENIEQQKCLNLLSQMIKEYVEKNKIEDLAVDKVKFENALEAKPENFNNFTLDTKNFVFYFDETQIGGTRDGVSIQIPIPATDVIKISKDAYPEIKDINKYVEGIYGENDTQTAQPAEKPVVQYDKNKKYLAITFDDGPHPKNTDHLLDELKKLNARATFFVVGERLAKNEQIIKKMIEDNNEVGNHSFSHPDFRTMKNEQIKKQIDDTNKLIFNITGKMPTSLRTPYGILNDTIKNISKNDNMSLIMWDVDTLDWKYRDAKRIKQNILTNARNGDIILLHDIYNTSVEAAIMAIKELEQQGYEFVTVSELISLKGVAPVSGDVYFNVKLGT